jgi:hypothetical protein
MPSLWPFCPTPEFTEALEWASEVLSAYSAEQRIRQSSAYRQTLTLAHTMTFRQWERAKLLVKLVAGGSWYIPLWHERQRVSVSSGAASVAVDTLASDYRPGGYACLWASDEACEVVTINTVGPSSITLTGTTSRAYDNGLIMPARIAYAPDGIEGSRTVQPAVPVAAEFLVYDDTDLGDASLYPTYRTYPVVTDCPLLAGGSFSEQLARSVDSVDNAIAVPFFDAVSDRLSHSLGLAWMPDTLADLWDLRQFLCALYGRQKAFWVPDWTRGLELTDDIAPADGTIRVRALGLNGVAETGDLFLQTVSGTTSRHQYTSVAVSGDDEVLTLSGTAGVTVGISSVRTLCLMRLCRLAQNRIELAHRHLGSERQITSVMVRCDEVPIP